MEKNRAWKTASEEALRNFVILNWEDLSKEMRLEQT